MTDRKLRKPRFELELHISGGRAHSCRYHHGPTGVVFEVVTPVKPGRHYADLDRFGTPDRGYYHPAEPPEVTHDTFEEAVLAAVQIGALPRHIARRYVALGG